MNEPENTPAADEAPATPPADCCGEKGAEGTASVETAPVEPAAE